MMESTTPGMATFPPQLQPIELQYTKLKRSYQQTMDRLTPHMLGRWVGTAGLLGLFLLRIVFAQGVS